MIKILLVDDRRLMLETIKAILKDESEIEIVGTAQNGITAIVQIAKLQPDIVLIDIEMPRMDGIATTEYINRHLSDTKVIILTSHKEQSYITQALQAGASSYLAKDSLIKDLKQAIYCLDRGYSYLDTKLLNKTVNQIQASNIVKNRTIYPKRYRKYRKHIYVPSVRASKSKSSDLATAKNVMSGSTKAHSVINKATTATPTFSLSNTNKNEALEHFPLTRAYEAKKKKNHHHKLWKKGIFLAIAIASLILSIIIF